MIWKEILILMGWVLTSFETMLPKIANPSYICIFFSNNDVLHQTQRWARKRKKLKFSRRKHSKMTTRQYPFDSINKAQDIEESINYMLIRALFIESDLIDLSKVKRRICHNNFRLNKLVVKEIWLFNFHPFVSNIWSSCSSPLTTKRMVVIVPHSTLPAFGSAF